MIKRILTLFIGLAFALTLCGCKNNEQNSDFIKSFDEKKYYFAANKDSEALLNEMCAGYNKQAENGLSEKFNASFSQVKFFADSVTSSAEQTESLRGKDLRIGFIENGELCKSTADDTTGIFRTISHLITSDIRVGENSAKIENVIFKSEKDAINALEEGSINAVVGAESCDNENLLFSTEFCTDRLVFYSKYTPSSLTYPILYTAKEYKLQAEIFTASPNIRSCETVESAVSSFNSDENSAYFGMLSEVITLI